MMYCYKQTEPNLYTVGYYDPHNEWVTASDHSTRDLAAKRVQVLNGSGVWFVLAELLCDRIEIEIERVRDSDRLSLATKSEVRGLMKAFDMIVETMQETPR